MQTPNVVRIIDSVSFEGLKQLKASEVKKQARLHVHAGDTLDLSELVGDLGRLYATRLFEVVDYRLDLVDGNRYLLTYLVKESSTKILGLGLRYDNDYGFVALGEFSARQLFGGASSATISSQFGGLEEYSASLHLIPSLAPSLFLEPRIGFRKQQRLDFRNQELVNTFTDRRTGGRLIAGGTLFHFLEAEGGYHRERVRIRGGSNLDPSTVSPAILAGLTFGLYRDTLDHPEFPRGGARSQLLIEKQSTALGSDFDYSRWQMDYQRYFAFSDKSTVLFNAGAGFTRGSVPFYDLFFVGGHSHAVGASRPFLGLDRDEIRANQMFILGASYQRQIFSSSLGFVKRGYAVGAYNGLWFSARQKTPYQFDRINGFGGGIAINTMFGPVRAMVGLAEGGRAHFYINIGPRF
jgi:outer membrane protein assembly factor BamA